MSRAAETLERELDERLRRRWTTALMNDTKWREVCLVLAELETRFHFAYADADAWNLHSGSSLFGPLRHGMIWDRGIRDPGIGGPFLFKEILKIEVPKVHRWASGHVTHQDLDRLFARLSPLGLLPIEMGESYLRILGYR